ncbi:hypothetical protein TNCV_1402251 [Trichonephila clavipes]|nr:hypothetical protein TNCV_1402251 [Trichonephila clavipes]
MSSFEQRVNIKVCVLFEKSPETLEMLKNVYGNYSSSRGFLSVSMAENEKERSVDSGEVIQNATKQLKDLLKNRLQKCFEQLYER